MSPTVRSCELRAGWTRSARATRAARARAKSEAGAPVSGRPPTVLALDFDGVLCDSVMESSATGWRAAAKVWPAVFSGATDADEAQVAEQMRKTRPVVETGFENFVMARALLEQRCTPGEVLERWDEILPELMREWGVERAAAVELFGAERDAWIEEDLDGWLAPNSFYDGIPVALRGALMNPDAFDVSIVTTKQARFTFQLLNDMARAPVPMERIYSTTVSGRPKTDMLKKLASGSVEGSRLVFVEDKLSTLEKVRDDPECARWELFLVDWGYNTAQERARADADSDITVIGIEDFCAMLAP